MNDRQKELAQKVLEQDAKRRKSRVFVVILVSACAASIIGGIIGVSAGGGEAFRRLITIGVGLILGILIFLKIKGRGIGGSWGDGGNGNGNGNGNGD